MSGDRVDIRLHPYQISWEDDGQVVIVVDTRDGHVVSRGYPTPQTISRLTTIAVALNDEHRRVHLPLEQKFEARTATANALQEALDKHLD